VTVLAHILRTDAHLRGPRRRGVGFLWVPCETSCVVVPVRHWPPCNARQNTQKWAALALVS
jgi:hypothetical protein